MSLFNCYWDERHGDERYFAQNEDKELRKKLDALRKEFGDERFLNVLKNRLRMTPGYTSIPDYKVVIDYYAEMCTDVGADNDNDRYLIYNQLDTERHPLLHEVAHQSRYNSVGYRNFVNAYQTFFKMARRTHDHYGFDVVERIRSCVCAYYPNRYIYGTSITMEEWLEKNIILEYDTLNMRYKFCHIL